MTATYLKTMLKVLALLGVTLMTFSCKDDLDGQFFTVSDELTISHTLNGYDEFSVYSEILEKTGFYTTLQSYGSYTCFVPVDSVWDIYMQERWGVTSISQLDTEEQLADLKELVMFHTTAKGRASSAFIEGRMSDTTFTGDYLTTSYLDGGGVGNVTINREAKMLFYDISADNGQIHAIDHVLTPYSDPIPVKMENAGKHTIFVEAMKQTGWYDVFSQITKDDGSKMILTLFAETDSIYAENGIHSFDDLNAMFGDDMELTDPLNSLNRFVAYHGAYTFMYTSDLPEDAFVNSVLEGNVIKVGKEDMYIQLNIEELADGTTDWTNIVSEYSNMPAKNGVYHSVDKIFDIYTPAQEYIIWDPVDDQPEYIAGLIKTHTTVEASFWSEIDWYPSTQTVRFLQMSSNRNLNYSVMDSSPNCVWYEYTTPTLPKGKYELLICSNGGNSARGQFQIYWDGVPIGSVYDVTTKGVNIGYPDSVAMEANGWRAGYKEITNGSGETQYDNSNCMRFVVTKELLCSEQTRHTLKFMSVKSGGMPLDYIEFIPVVE